ncbi:MAG: Crp/Fnr family transcriptional regulator [Alphaproteobacteria bacterium]|nr:Crp/Fnr family transcriptional regulator [Alphaproteobacteria bacterium]
MSVVRHEGNARLSHACARCGARAGGLCRICAPEIMAGIEQCKTGDRALRAGETIFLHGDNCNSVYTISDGWAYLYALRPDGGRQILHYALPGDFIGFHPGAGAAITYGAQALTDLNLCVMARDGIERLNRDHPEIGMRVAWMLSRNLSLTYDHLTSVTRQSARERVAHLLLQLYVRRRMHWPDTAGDQIDLPLTQELIADTLGLTAVHVNRTLASLRREGVLHFKLGRLRILDPDRLIEVADLAPEIVENWIAQGATRAH